jgi:hypothetical protein
VSRLIALYPRAWRDRYGEEFAAMVAALSADGPSRYGRLRLALDIIRGAFDAHLNRRSTMNPALRRGVLDGLLLAAVIATVLFLSNVVFPGGPNESDDDPEYLVQILAAYLLLAVAFVVIGVRARRRLDTDWAGALGGAAAGLVIAIGVLVATLVIDNAWLALVSQQHDKRVAFAGSGWTSMRAYLNVRTLFGAVFVLPVATIVGGVLGLVGGLIGGRRRRPEPVA